MAHFHPYESVSCEAAPGMLAVSAWGWVGWGLALGLIIAGFWVWRFTRAGLAFEASWLSPPFRIHLAPATDASWTQSSDAVAVAGQLRDIGFADAGVYDIPEMPSVGIWGFVQSSTHVAAALYSKGERLWVDMESFYEDGSSIGYSTVGVGAELPRPSCHPQVRFSEVPLATLHHRLVTDRPRGVLRRVSPDLFVRLFEENYAQQQDWLAERGGYTAEEIRTLLPAGTKLKPDALAVLREKVAHEALMNWLRTQPEMPMDSEGTTECIAIIHDEMTWDRLLLTYGQMTQDWDADEKHVSPHAKSPRAAFEALNDIRKGGLVKFLEKGTPLCADFYCHDTSSDDGR